MGKVRFRYTHGKNVEVKTKSDDVCQLLTFAEVSTQGKLNNVGTREVRRNIEDKRLQRSL